MALRAPPAAIFFQVERVVPGLVRAFVQRLGSMPPGTQATSWYRTPGENAAVGGAADSQHQWAAAVDLVGNLGAIEDAARRAGLVAVRAATHVHVQAWPAGLGRQVGLPQSLGL